MKQLLIALSMLISYPSYAALWDLYDGDGSNTNSNAPAMQAGVTYTWYNRAAWLRWENEGGDWKDADGVRQGPKPISSARINGSIVELDAIDLLSAPGILLKKSGSGNLSLYSRESSAPPILELTFPDDSVVRLSAEADSTLSSSTSSGQGKNLTLNLANSAVMYFDEIPVGAVSAKLILKVSSGGNASVDAYAMHVPRQPFPVVSTGYASNYPGDVGIMQDPRTIYFEDWQRPNGDPPKDWWARTGTTKGPTPSWKQDGGLFLNPNFSGMWIANGGEDVTAQCSDQKVKRETGFIGDGLMGVHCKDVLARGTEVPTVWLATLTGKEHEELWARYYIKYDEKHNHSELCEGGKAPGFAGNTVYGGNSGMPGWGVRGWSMRNQFHLICDPLNPAYNKVDFSVYAYDGDRFNDLNGGHWGGGEQTLLDVNRWYCIEQHVKINTPGKWDGIVELYVDGRPAMSKTDVFLRDVKPPQGYGKWQLVSKTYPIPLGAITHTDTRGHLYYYQGASQEGDLGISKFWGMIHWGGKTPSGDTHQMWYDQTVVGTERIGCAAAGDPPHEPTPEEEIENLKGEIARLETALAGERKTINAMREDLEILRTDISRLEGLLVIARVTVDTMQASNEIAQAQITELDAALTDRSAQLVKAQQDFADAQVRAAKAQGTIDKIKEALQ